MSTVIVTGAGSGIGRAICLKLAEKSWKVALVGRRVERLEETLALISEKTGRDGHLILPADVSGQSQVLRVVEQVNAEWGVIDAIVNNAAVARAVAIEATTRELLEEVFATNTFGPAFLISAVVPIFERQGHGVVVNISSLAAIDPFPGFFAYAASKAALESLVRSVRNECPFVTAFTLRVGMTDTEMIDTVFDRSKLTGMAFLAPDDVADIVMDCVEGRVDPAAGPIEITR